MIGISEDFRVLLYLLENDPKKFSLLLKWNFE